MLERLVIKDDSRACGRVGRGQRQSDVHGEVVEALLA